MRGLHGRVVSFLAIAVALGGAAGFALHLAFASGAAGAGVAVLLGLAAVAWPLTWVATFRIARPVSELARLASELHGGQLERRANLSGSTPDEVGELSDALHGLAERLARQLSDQRALMAAVSHELRSPLARLRVMVELEREGQGSATVHDELQAEIDGMDGLVADLLAAARIDFEAITPVDQPAREVALRALQLASLPDSLLHDAAPGVSVTADATLLARALSVLLDNAQRHGGAAVTMRISTDSDAVRFEVQDDGPGFAAGEEEQAFQPFWRRPAQDGGGNGVGLGLALVRQIAVAHGGQAAARNRPGGGAQVWIELPL